MEASEIRSRAFFGRRKGHKLRANRARLLETLLPRLALDLVLPAPADLNSLFPVKSRSRSALAAASR
jgi:tRNA (guanine-N7-)-methyltransferase